MNQGSQRSALLITPTFFGIEHEIAAELERRGFRVDFLSDRPFESPFLKAAGRLSRASMLRMADRFYQSHLDATGRPDYELVLVIVGEGLSQQMLRRMRTALPRARFILYMWDSLTGRKSGVADNLSLFDQCLTFDPDDAKTFGLELRPLFYTERFDLLPQKEPAYDLSFVGTIHSDRYRVISSVAGQMSAHRRCYWYLYLQADWVYAFYRIVRPGFWKTRRSDFRFQPLSRTEVTKIFMDSRAVLDVEHPTQTGLTLRTFEALGARKKLVTTNALVRNYEFYDPRNICVIDRKTCRFDEGFLDTAYVELSPEIRKHYSLAGWADQVLGHTEPRRTGVN
jgi:hypothetical protein